MRVKITVRALLLIVTSVFGGHLSKAQEPAVTGQVISGMIRDEATGKPVRNVNVFFEGTMNGTASDSTGRFTLYARTNAKLPILVSGVGYFSKTVSDYSFGKELLITLKERFYSLETVTITANEGMSRKDKLRIFRREFLGSSSNAKSCQILNEDDIRLSWSSKTRTLTASCDKPVVIHNKNLGYTLHFLLTEFTHSPQQTAYYGSQFFKEDTSLADPEKIQKARKKAYTGSKMHFIRALWENKLAENDFAVVRRTHKVPYDSLVVVRDNQKYLHFSEFSPMAVVYGSYFSYLQGSVRDILIDKSGYNYPIGTVWSGVMGTQRAGDLLPFEYTPKDLAPFDYSSTDKLQDIAAGERAQTSSTEIREIISSLDTLRSSMPAEKLYIQFDKPYYSAGDTLRMKAYLLDAALFKGSDKSGIVYVELANDTNKVFFRRMLPMGYGLGTGNIILDKADIPEGSYTLRAFTNLMRNFGEDLVFKKNFYIGGNSAETWLVNSQAVLSKQSGKDNIRLGLQLENFRKQALSFRELDLRVLDGRKVIQRDKMKTDMEGNLDVNFDLPEKLSENNLSVTLADTKDASHKITVPVPVSRDEKIDLQFMPEGGNLVAGISSVVGFKVIGEDGQGRNVSGKVYSSNGSEVAVFSSSYKGMGSFELDPKHGGTYTAKVVLNGIEKKFPLPAVKSSGTAMRVINNAESDSLEISITVAGAAASSYYLTAQSRGIICYGAIIRFNGNNTNSRKIAKSLFPTGIARFTLMNADKQPLNERITFIDHHDNLHIEIKPSQPAYQTRDSIALAIEVKDQEGKPVEGSFSLAVTDDSQIRTDSLSSNLLSSLLLTSDLKGTVEEPGHYFQQTQQARKDLDNLLLTQGWTGYDWKDVFNPSVPKYAAEPEFIVSGRVSNVLNQGKSNLPVQLLSLKPNFIMNALTDKDGSFIFSGFPVTDSLRFFIQSRNRYNKSFNIGIEVDEFTPLEFKAPNQRYLPWYVNSDTVLLQQIATRAIQEARLNGKGNLLQQVTITAKKTVNNSKNLNGAGEADQILDDKDIAKTPKKTLLDLMKERVRGFNVGLWPATNVSSVGLTSTGQFLMDRPIPMASGPGGEGTRSKSSLGSSPKLFEKTLGYKIFDKELHLVIDGVDVESFYYPVHGHPFPTTRLLVAMQRQVDPGGDYILERNAADHDDRYRFIQTYLEGLLAEDIKGIEVMYDPKFNGRYKSKYASNVLPSLSVAGPDWAYVEVTTYSGNGAYIKTQPGTYLYRPVPYVNRAAFYRPKYAVKTNPLSDLRSTIHWEPGIVTDKEGKAIVSFYSADRPGTYSIIMEGSDMKGALGRQTGKITVR